MNEAINTDQDENAAVARWRTAQYQARLGRTVDILRPALAVKHAIDWDKLVDRTIEPEPTHATYVEYPPELKQPGAIDERYVREYTAWAETVKQIEAENQRRYNESVAAIEKWNAHRAAQLEDVTTLRAGYESLIPRGVEWYCKFVLVFSQFQDGSQREFSLEYVPESKILIVDYALPAPDDLVRIKEVKYVKASNEFVEVFLSEREFKQIYEDIVNQTCLRTLHELFDADKANALSAAQFRGWAESVDKATGRDTKVSVLSLHAEKGDFQRINLARVEPEACVNFLKSLSAECSKSNHFSRNE